MVIQFYVISGNQDDGCLVPFQRAYILSEGFSHLQQGAVQWINNSMPL